MVMVRGPFALAPGPVSVTPGRGVHLPRRNRAGDRRAVAGVSGLAVCCAFGYGSSDFVCLVVGRRSLMILGLEWGDAAQGESEAGDPVEQPV